MNQAKFKQQNGLEQYKSKSLDNKDKETTLSQYETAMNNLFR
jgi:hypothetical protein